MSYKLSTIIIAAMLCSMGRVVAQSDAQLFDEAFESLACMVPGCLTQDVPADNTTTQYGVASTAKGAEEYALSRAKYRSCFLAKEKAEENAAAVPCLNKTECVFESADALGDCTYTDPTTPPAQEIDGTNSKGYRWCLKYYAPTPGIKQHQTPKEHCDDLMTYKNFAAKAHITAAAEATQFCVSRACTIFTAY